MQRVDEYIQYIWFCYMLLVVTIDFEWFILKFMLPLPPCIPVNNIGDPHLHI